MILSEAASRCVVVDGVRPLGSLSLDRIADLLAAMTQEPVIPDFGRGSDCVREDRFFCWDWTKEHWDDTFQPALLEHVKLTLIAVGLGFVIAFALAYVAYRLRWARDADRGVLRLPTRSRALLSSSSSCP